MLVNMPRRTIVMVKSRTCHQVTSRLTSSDLVEVIDVFFHPTKVRYIHWSILLKIGHSYSLVLAVRPAVLQLGERDALPIVASPHRLPILLRKQS